MALSRFIGSHVTRLALLLIGLFLGSVVSILAGYLDLSTGLDWLQVKSVYESIPIFSLSFFMVFVFTFNMSFAFLESNGSFKGFKNSFLANTLVVTPLALVLTTPGSLETPDYIGGHYPLMLFLVVGLQLTIGHFLYKDFWLFGGRNFEQSDGSYSGSKTWEKVNEGVDNSLKSNSYVYASSNFWDTRNEEIQEALESVSFVLECIASNINGEAKQELGKKLIPRVREWPKDERREQLLNRLEWGYKSLFGIPESSAANPAGLYVGQANRILWEGSRKKKRE